MYLPPYEGMIASICKELPQLNNNNNNKIQNEQRALL